MADISDGQNNQLQMQKLTAENLELKGLYRNLMLSMTYTNLVITLG